VVDDVLGIAVLSAFVAIALGGSEGGTGAIWITIAQMFVFLIGSALLAYFIVPRILHYAEKLPVSQPMVAAVVVITLLFAWSSESLGKVAPITGAFVLGAGLSGSRFKHEIEDGLKGLAYAFLVPIFLVNIGLTANVRELSSNDMSLAIAICIVAVISKVVGCGLGARISGMNWQESLRVGVGMISRGEVGLIVATVGVTKGVIGQSEFTVAVVMVLVSTLVTPPLLRMVFRDSADKPDSQPPAKVKASVAAN
jgi:Kef-type K+ transport system membrane component KefB